MENRTPEVPPASEPAAELDQVVVHVDATTLVDADQPGQSVPEDGTYVSAETSRRLACDASRVVMRHDADGRLHPHDSPGATASDAPSGPRGSLPGLWGAGSARAITSVTGPTAARRRSPTLRCCVVG